MSKSPPISRGRIKALAQAKATPDRPTRAERGTDIDDSSKSSQPSRASEIRARIIADRNRPTWEQHYAVIWGIVDASSTEVAESLLPQLGQALRGFRRAVYLLKGRSKTNVPGMSFRDQKLGFAMFNLLARLVANPVLSEELKTRIHRGINEAIKFKAS